MRLMPVHPLRQARLARATSTCPISQTIGKMSDTKQTVRGLYAITPDITANGSNSNDLLRACQAALEGGVATLQYRQKSLATAEKYSLARELKTLCDAHHAKLIVNDDVALAQTIDATGVHLGRDDLAVASARQILGPQKIIGVSCYNQLRLADAAIRHGADYIAFGSFFPSRVKPMAVRADLALISAARILLQKTPNVTLVAIGGITLDNINQLTAAGTDSVAVISDLFNAPDIALQACAYAAHFAAHFTTLSSST
jgi:thiamine-phosphate pyrophosphorylase